MPQADRQVVMSGEVGQPVDGWLASEGVVGWVVIVETRVFGALHS